MLYNPCDNKLWDNIFSLMLLNENRIVRKDLKAVYKTADYSVNKLIQKGYIKIKFKTSPHMIYITAKGIDYLKNKNTLPEELMSLCNKKKLTYKDGDCIRVGRKSQVLTDAYLNNFLISDKLIFDNKKIFVPPVFLKQEIENNKDYYTGVTCKGVLTYKDIYYGLYTMMYGNQKLSPNIEVLTTTEIERALYENSNRKPKSKAKIVFDEGLAGLEKIIKNEEGYEKKLKYDNRIRPTKHTFDSVWGSTFYVPAKQEGIKHINAIIGDRLRLKEDLINKNNLEPNANIFFPFGTSMMKLIKVSSTPMIVYVPKENKEELREIITNKNVLLEGIDV